LWIVLGIETPAHELYFLDRVAFFGQALVQEGLHQRLSRIWQDVISAKKC
jgi:hypothetical protein